MIDLGEQVEDAREHFRSNSDAVVANLEGDQILIDLDSQADVPSRLGVLGRVVQ